MSEKKERPSVGVGVFITNDKSEILVGKREGNHAPYWSIFGGHLEQGETFEAAAIREMKEEVGIDIEDPIVVAVTNNLETYKDHGKHGISVILYAHSWAGEIKNMEPAKCSEFRWVDPHQLPEPHFDASRKGIACWLEGVFYKS